MSTDLKQAPPAAGKAGTGPSRQGGPAPAGAKTGGPTQAAPKVVVEAYSFRRQGWPRVRRACITFGIVVLLSGALVTGGRMLLARTVPATAAAQQKQIAARERHGQAETERDEIRQFQPSFGQLRARGFVGPENRLAMLEAIRDIQRAHGLLPITYEFAPQQLVALEPAQLAAPLELHSSTVTLHMGLLHEMDLVNFMRDLKSKGVFTVKECQLAARDVGPVAGPNEARITADCSLFWLTVGEAAPAAPVGT
jgi:hypothetical protein